MPVITPWEPNFWEPLDTTAIALTLQKDELLVYPVPTNGQLFIKYDFDNVGRHGELELDVYSMTGRLVLRQEYQASSLIELSLEGQAAGLYLLRINVDGKTLERRVVRY